MQLERRPSASARRRRCRLSPSVLPSGGESDPDCGLRELPLRVRGEELTQLLLPALPVPLPPPPLAAAAAVAALGQLQIVGTLFVWRRFTAAAAAAAAAAADSAATGQIEHGSLAGGEEGEGGGGEGAQGRKLPSPSSPSPSTFGSTK